jgi:uncharacterized protein YlxW (UPF0749 family)
MRRLPWRVGALLVLVSTGLLLAVSAATSGGTDLRPERYEDVEDLVRAQSRRVTALTDDAARLRTDVDRLHGEADDPAVTAAREQAAALAVPAGLTPVTGPGVTVSLEDAPLPGQGAGLPEGTTYDDFVVHQQDVEGVVNALWAGGAEAMTIMDRRIVNTSAVRCVGNVLILDGQVYSPPFVITAIGDPGRLQDALAAAPAVQAYRAWAEIIGLGYEERRVAQVTMPAFAGSLGVGDLAEPAP